jgi:hypothetical protein
VRDLLGRGTLAVRPLLDAQAAHDLLQHGGGAEAEVASGVHLGHVEAALSLQDGDGDLAGHVLALAQRRQRLGRLDALGSPRAVVVAGCLAGGGRRGGGARGGGPRAGAAARARRVRLPLAAAVRVAGVAAVGVLFHVILLRCGGLLAQAQALLSEPLLPASAAARHLALRVGAAAAAAVILGPAAPAGSRHA